MSLTLSLLVSQMEHVTFVTQSHGIQLNGLLVCQYCCKHSISKTRKLMPLPRLQGACL